MRYFKFSVFLLILIICLFVCSRAETVQAYGPCYDDKSITLEINPTTTSSTININGRVDGDSTEEGTCGSSNYFLGVYPITTIEYQIDGGAWISLTWVDEWRIDQAGFNGCDYQYQVWVYAYQKNNIDVSGLSDGSHALTVRAWGGHCPSGQESISTSTTFIKSSIICNCDYLPAAGWYDPPFWNGCNDCSKNSVHNYLPCHDALAWCDGCNWHTEWEPFRDEGFGTII